MTRYERLAKKYNSSVTETNKSEIKVTAGPDRNKAMTMTGKPKDLKKTIVRLINYLAYERKVLLLAILCTIINTVVVLAGSYMLRPIINTFIYYDKDNMDLSDRLEGLFNALVVLAIMYIVGVVTQWLQQRLMLNVSQMSLKRMRNDLYTKVQKLPMRYFDNNSTGDIMSRFTNDVDTVGEMLNTTLIQLISGIITVVGTVVLMLVTNWMLGLITIIATPLLTIVSKTIVKKGRSAYVRQQKNIGMLNGFTEEIISGQKVVKVFNHEEIAIDEFEYLNAELTRSQIKAQFNSALMGPVTHQLCNVVYALTALAGGILVVKNGFDIGGLTISLNYTRQFNRPINEISMQMNTVFAALAGAERVFEVLDEEVESGYEAGTAINENGYREDCVVENRAGAVNIENVYRKDCAMENIAGTANIENVYRKDCAMENIAGAVNIENVYRKDCAVENRAGAVINENVYREDCVVDNMAGNLCENLENDYTSCIKTDKIIGNIVMKNVYFGYEPDNIILHDISLYAKPGQKIAFVGSTGAGKTTVTNLLSRFYDLQAGQILIDGIPIDQIDKGILRSNIAMVLQDTHLFTGTVMENIRYGRLDATDEEVIMAAKVASAHSFIMHLENGYDTMIENDGANLSQGQRQLLNIARAAISKAPILVLDEATSSVDTRTERHIEEGMDALMQNRTTLVIAHRLSTVRKANVIMVLENGRIVERGTHEELLRMNGRYARLNQDS